jgi:coatomer subunit gamma
MQATI